ncbi:MAG: hypothetical protein JXN60_05705 [Lentisphaerae bacterium]|nr:hypothetical protein [Lentisphaerota bacterium]
MKRALMINVAILLCLGRIVEGGELIGKKPVLIAAQQSDFKDAVVVRVVEELKKHNIETRIIKMAELKQHKAETYEAVVMIQSIWAWRLARPVRKFLKATPDDLRARLILVSTAANSDWRTKEKGLHAITSASKIDKTSKIADFVIARIFEIFKR